MRIPTILSAAVLLATAASAVSAAPAPETSWGRAGVSYDEYRADASRCLHLVERIDLEGTQPAQALITATRRIENLSGQIGAGAQDLGNGFDNVVANQIAGAVAQARPEVRFRQIRDLMRTAMTACLTELGYTRFRLTEAQREQLRHLRSRQPARHAYLHRLASDPNVIAAQAVPEAAEE
jgi:hypothetical protein